jgi:hypothetical protein
MRKILMALCAGGAALFLGCSDLIDVTPIDAPIFFDIGFATTDVTVAAGLAEL